jgi:hypothetical protein
MPTPRLNLTYLAENEPFNADPINRLANETDAAAARKTDVDAHLVSTSPHPVQQNLTVNGTLTGTAVGTGATQVAPGNHSHPSSPPRLIANGGSFYTIASTGWASPTELVEGTRKAAMEFSGTTDNQADLDIAVPTIGYNGTSPITFRLYWKSGTTGDVVWEVQAAASGDDAAISGTLTSRGTVTGANSGANANRVDTIVWNTALPAAGDDLQVRVIRRGGSDANGGVAYLRKLVVEFGP